MPLTDTIYVKSHKGYTLSRYSQIAGSVAQVQCYYMDKQEDKLRAQLQSTGVSVTRNADNIILNMPGNITFATNSSNISADFYKVLDSVALVINEFEKTYVDVYGYTDSTGSAAHNQALSKARTSSVASYLISQEVTPQRVVTHGIGESQPIASNDTPEGRTLNRRVEIVLIPNHIKVVKNTRVEWCGVPAGVPSIEPVTMSGPLPESFLYRRPTGAYIVGMLPTR